MLKQGLKNKIGFVSDLSKAVGNRVSGIESLDYAVFEDLDHGWYDEYLVVNYKGGAVQARNCSGNSNAAILEELGKMVYSSQVFCGDTETYLSFIKRAKEAPNFIAVYNAKNL